jgi:hypothetical protein
VSRIIRRGHLLLVAAFGKRLDVGTPLTLDNRSPQTRAQKKAAEKEADWARLNAMMQGWDRPRR